MNDTAEGGPAQSTIPLKEAASLLWDFYRDALRSLTLLPLNVLRQKKNVKIPLSSFKESLFFNLRPNGLQISLLLTFEIFGSARNHGKKFPK